MGSCLAVSPVDDALLERLAPGEGDFYGEVAAATITVDDVEGSRRAFERLRLSRSWR
jgi:hypothetical protein